MITYLYRVAQLKSFYFIYRIVCSCAITSNPNNELYNTYICTKPPKNNVNGEHSSDENERTLI